MLIQIDMMTHVVLYMRWFDRSGDVCVLDKEVVGVHRAQRETYIDTHKKTYQTYPGVSIILILTPSRMTAKFFARIVIPRSLFFFVANICIQRNMAMK